MQRPPLAGGDGGERLRIAAQVATNMTDNAWRKAAPLVLEWKTTAGEKGPWRIRLAKNPDFTGARDLWLECEDAAKCGVTEEDIAAFRAIMLEKQGKKQEDANGAK